MLGWGTLFPEPTLGLGSGVERREALPWNSEQQPRGLWKAGEGPRRTWLCEASDVRRQARPQPGHGS